MNIHRASKINVAGLMKRWAVVLIAMQFLAGCGAGEKRSSEPTLRLNTTRDGARLEYSITLSINPGFNQSKSEAHVVCLLMLTDEHLLPASESWTMSQRVSLSGANTVQVATLGGAYTFGQGIPAGGNTLTAVLFVDDQPAGSSLRTRF